MTKDELTRTLQTQGIKQQSHYDLREDLTYTYFYWTIGDELIGYEVVSNGDTRNKFDYNISEIVRIKEESKLKFTYPHSSLLLD